MLDEVTAEIVKFRDERKWKRFHSVKNLSASIAIEAAELLEIFQWVDDANLAEVTRVQHEAIADELADVWIYTLMLAHDLGINPIAAIRAKLQKNARKYPIPG